MNEMRTLIESIAKINEGSDIQVGNAELVGAYNESTRQLDVRGEPTSLGTWHRIMSKALAQDGGDGTYNEFDVNVVSAGLRDAIVGLGIGETDVKFIPAREYSVAMYITGEYETLDKIGSYIDKNRENFADVDELHLYEDGTSGLPGPILRLWWD